jgi:SAM-dependent methyltransferase
MNAAAADTCFSCGGGNLRHFYEVRGIPVHSTLLMDSREEATSYPKGDLRLGFCERCGFIQNTLFDPKVHEYSPKCEESQGFSARFNRFLEAMTARLIRDHDLRGKRVLEIGCGKGDFLELICQMGDNDGIGIDPGVQPERKDRGAGRGIEFINDLYSEKYGHLTGDMVACRHTLEHVQATRDFVQIVRRAVADHPSSVIFFELPDVERVLKETAFWDVYYEHCSYFSLGSLARLFRACDFDLVRLEKDFGDQYLMLEGHPGARAAARKFPGEDDLETLAADVDNFETTCRATLARWKDLIGEYRRHGKTVVIWGSSSKGTAFLTTLGLGEEIAYVVDINPYRQNKFMPGTGHEIVAPELMRDVRPDAVIVMNPIYCDEIGAQLAAMGVKSDLIPA